MIQEIGRIGAAFAPWVQMGALIAALVGLFWFKRYTREKLTVEELRHRSELALNVKVLPRVFEQGDEWFLEAQIEVTNASNKTWCVPAAYIMARALVDKESAHEYEHKTNFSDLPLCEPLSVPLNCAYHENSIIQVAPDETESFVRWERLDRQFVDRYPVVVISAEVFGASHDLIGEFHFPKHRCGPYRDRWVEYMKNRISRHDEAVVFERWRKKGDNDPFAPGQRFIQTCIDDQLLPDLTASREYRSVLETVVQWSRQTTVDLRGAAREEAT